MLEKHKKQQTALKTIGEAASILGLEQHVLRFWEKKFSQIKPVKSRGRRYYRPEDIEIIKEIQHLLYNKGLTIKGAISHLNSKKHTQEAPLEESANASRSLDRETINTIHQKLVNIRKDMALLFEE